MTDYIGYEALTQAAMRGVVRFFQYETCSILGNEQHRTFASRCN
jgi:hypothetical protein